MKIDRIRLVVCGGGTGGHVIPALSICRKIKEFRPDTEILYIGARDSLEERLATQEGYGFRSVWISSLRRGRIVSNLMLPLKMKVSLIQAIVHLSRYRPDMVIGTGGFSAWPACTAARITRRPYVLQEQNAYPGLVTRLLARGARRIYIGYEDVTKRLNVKKDRFLLTGNPIQTETDRINLLEARRILGLDPSNLTLFVTGGSGGAASINRVIDQVKDKLLERGYNLIWQTGKHWEKDEGLKMKDEYYQFIKNDKMTPLIKSCSSCYPVKNIGDMAVQKDLSGRLIIERFFDRERMTQAYAASDIAVARCGAITLAELAAAGLPVILIPFPYAAGGHQEANARAVEAAGGARLILDKDLNPDTLLQTVDEISQPEKLENMSIAMKKLAHPDAAERIAKDIIELCARTGALAADPTLQ